MSSPLRVSQHLDESKEIDRYLRCMTLKCAQYVVNSRCPRQRSSQKSFTRSASEHWFNLSIAENSTLLEEIRYMFDGRQLELSQPFCIRIYLRTNEDETMLVEQWLFKKSSIFPFSSNSSKSVLYSNLTTLLKSLIVMTTSLPGNSLSRRQTSSSYLLHYKLKLGEPEIASEDNFKQHSIGSVYFLGVQFSMCVAWKTKLQFAPRKRCEIATALNESYFDTSSIPKRTQPQSVSPRIHRDRLNSGSPALTKVNFQLTLPDDDSDEDVPFGRLLQIARTPTPPCTPPLNPSRRHRNLSEVENGVLFENADEGEDDAIVKNIEQTTTNNDSKFITKKPHLIRPPDPFRATFAPHFNDIKQLSVFCEEIPELEMFKDEEEEGGVEDLVQQFLHLEAAKEEIFEFVKMVEGIDETFNFY